MAEQTNKIEGSLSVAQLQALLEELKAISAKPTFKQIQAAAARYGVDVSLMSARTFRRTTFAEHLKRIAEGREKTQRVLEAVRGSESALTAFEEIAANDILDAYTNGDEEIDREKLIKAGATLRSAIAEREASQRAAEDLARKQRETDAKLQLAEQTRTIAEERARKLEREREAWEAAQKKIAEANAQLKSAKPEDADAIRAKVVDMLDDVLGIKPAKATSAA